MFPLFGGNVLMALPIMPNNEDEMTDLIAVQKIAGWEKLKTLVLDSVSSPITKRVYNIALDEFMQWFQQAPRPGFTKATVSAWRVSLEARGLGSSSIIIRMSAIRKLAAEAADNGLLAPELAAGISRVKSAKTQGIRTGNWLSQRQAQALAANVKRDAVRLAVFDQEHIDGRGSCADDFQRTTPVHRPLLHAGHRFILISRDVSHLRVPTLCRPFASDSP
jgi:hypothetical protein